MEIIKAGTKIVFKAHVGHCGTDTCEFYILVDDMVEDTLIQEAWEFGVHHAESYGVYNRGGYSDEDIEGDEDIYSDNIEGWYELYDPKEHDGLRVSGGNHFQEL
jgi:hypothetical protein